MLYSRVRSVTNREFLRKKRVPRDLPRPLLHYPTHNHRRNSLCLLQGHDGDLEVVQKTGSPSVLYIHRIRTEFQNKFAIGLPGLRPD